MNIEQLLEMKCLYKNVYNVYSSLTQPRNRHIFIKIMEKLWYSHNNGILLSKRKKLLIQEHGCISKIF